MSLEQRCEKNVPLSELSTFGIGGNARFFFRATSIVDVLEAFSWASLVGCPVLVIGKGSNCLFPDEGFSGLVMHNAIEEITEDGGIVHVGGGNSFAAFGVRMARNGWAGVEFAAGIPGSVGGAVVMNAGACGRQAADSLLYVDYVDANGSVERFQKKNIEFGYRFSCFQTKSGAVVGAGFCLERSDDAKERQQAMMEYRMRTQPLKERSAGCVFRNPQGFSAGKLIEEAGLKGYTIGGAAVSTVHANFIVNQGGATAQNVRELIEHIQRTVADKTGHWLQNEVKVITS
jgi:UDP-N-acetylmuramate dehydrogenase